MVDLPYLSAGQREQLGDARLLLDAAAHNAAMLLKSRGGLNDEQRQALDNAAALAAQAAGTIRRIQLAVKKG